MRSDWNPDESPPRWPEATNRRAVLGRVEQTRMVDVRLLCYVATTVSLRRSLSHPSNQARLPTQALMPRVPMVPPTVAESNCQPCKSATIRGAQLRRSSRELLATHQSESKKRR